MKHYSKEDGTGNRVITPLHLLHETSRLCSISPYTQKCWVISRLKYLRRMVKMQEGHKNVVLLINLLQCGPDNLPNVSCLCALTMGFQCCCTGKRLEEQTTNLDWTPQCFRELVFFSAILPPSLVSPHLGFLFIHSLCEPSWKQPSFSYQMLAKKASTGGQVLFCVLLSSCLTPLLGGKHGWDATLRLKGSPSDLVSHLWWCPAEFTSMPRKGQIWWGTIILRETHVPVSSLICVLKCTWARSCCYEGRERALLLEFTPNPWNA